MNERLDTIMRHRTIESPTARRGFVQVVRSLTRPPESSFLPAAIRAAASPAKITGDVDSPVITSSKKRTGEQKGVLAILRFPVTGCRGHPCRRKCETHRGFHFQSSSPASAAALAEGRPYPPRLTDRPLRAPPPLDATASAGGCTASRWTAARRYASTAGASRISLRARARRAAGPGCTRC